MCHAPECTCGRFSFLDLVFLRPLPWEGRRFGGEWCPLCDPDPYICY